MSVADGGIYYRHVQRHICCATRYWSKFLDLYVDTLLFVSEYLVGEAAHEMHVFGLVLVSSESLFSRYRILCVNTDMTIKIAGLGNHKVLHHSL